MKKILTGSLLSLLTINLSFAGGGSGAAITPPETAPSTINESSARSTGGASIACIKPNISNILTRTNQNGTTIDFTFTVNQRTYLWEDLENLKEGLIQVQNEMNIFGTTPSVQAVKSNVYHVSTTLPSSSKTATITIAHNNIELKRCPAQQTFKIDVLKNLQALNLDQTNTNQSQLYKADWIETEFAPYADNILMQTGPTLFDYYQLQPYETVDQAQALELIDFLTGDESKSFAMAINQYQASHNTNLTYLRASKEVIQSFQGDLPVSHDWSAHPFQTYFDQAVTDGAIGNEVNPRQEIIWGDLLKLIYFYQ